MAFIGLQVPLDAAQLLESVQTPGEKEDTASLHVTILHMGDNLPISTVAQAMMAAYSVTAKHRPFLVCCDRVDSFPPNPEYGIPVIAPVQSPPLLALHAALCVAFDAAGVPYSKKHPEYKPHVTLARNFAPDAKPYRAQLPGFCAWVAYELVIWGGSDGDGRVNIHLPFILAPGYLMVAAKRIAAAYKSFPI